MRQQSVATRTLPDAAAEAATRRRDRWLLLLAALVTLAPGLGLRDPWPADEPRFALIARDMVATGQWLFPQVGGDWYQDKPPLYFWLMAMTYAVTGVLRVAFLLPSLFAAIGCLLLVHDLGRRLWSREVGLLAALLLLFSVQFTLQARVAQIDMMLCLLSTAGLYGIVRHLLQGPDWRCYAFGGVAAGLGVITKGTGFLPLLAVLPYLLLHARGFSVAPGATAGWRWSIAPLAGLVAIALWFVPMVLTATLSGDAGLAAYRDELLFKQTVTRYAAAWHHHEPWHYFLTSVIPVLWLPGVLLLPWLVPRWAAAWRARDARPWLLLGWVVLVLLFFSASPGKRGVYILPALPAFVLAAASALWPVLQRRGVQRVGLVLALCVAAVLLAAFVWLGFIEPERGARLLQRHGATSLLPLPVTGVLIVAAVLLAGVRRRLLAWPVTLVIVCWIQGLWINPQLDDARSGRAFMQRVERLVPHSAELGLVGYREQFLLQATRPVVSFGHRRWAEGRREAEDAALWLRSGADRWLLVDEDTRRACFSGARAQPVGEAGRVEWFLVTGSASEDCVHLGRADAAIPYAGRGPH